MLTLVLAAGSVFGANGDPEISRAEYHEKLQGFWLGQCITNWTGLTTEGERKKPPFLTKKAWGTKQGRKNKMIEFVLVEEGGVWGADDDTDIEYIFQEFLLDNATSMLTPEQIRDGWLKHIKTDDIKKNFLWVSNQKALDLMLEGMLPPDWRSRVGACRRGHYRRREHKTTPISPPSGPAWAGVAERRLSQWLFQEPPADSKFLAAR